MNRDELEVKIIQVKKRGLPAKVEESIIRETRQEFYDKYFYNKIKHITMRFSRNILFLAKLHGTKFNIRQIYDTMGVTLGFSTFNDILYNKHVLDGLRTPLILAEYFGIPVELLLFQDLEANESALKEQYPALFKQSRD